MAQAGNNQLVPVQACRLPTPRNLTLNESRESLSNWLDNVQSFFTRDTNFQRFVAPGATWDPNHATYGFAAEGNETKLRRTALEVRQALIDFFNGVSMFFPFNFLKRRFLTSTSYEDMKKIVYEAYNVQLNSSSLILVSDLQKGPEENYYIFYERLHDFYAQHLVGPNVNAAGFNTGANGDTMTLSYANSIAHIWLEKINKKLPKLVAQEYGHDLRGGEHLASLVPRIASDMDGLLTKLEESRITRMLEESRITRVRSRGRGGLGPARGGGGRDQQAHCAHCKHLGQELGVRVPYDHSPIMCRRKKIHVRKTKIDEVEEEDLEDVEGGEYEEEDLFEEDSAGAVRSSPARTNTDTLQMNRSLSEKSTEAVPPDILLSPLSTAIRRLELTGLLSDNRDIALGQLEILVRRIADRRPSTAASPALWGNFDGNEFITVIDEGAEINCIDLDLAQKMKIPFVPTNAAARAAGEGRVEVRGVTLHDFVFHTDFHGQTVPVDLQATVVVNRLGSDVICGEPGRKKNKIATDSGRDTISMRYNGNFYTKPYLVDQRKSYRVAKIKSSTTIFAGEDRHIDVPDGLEEARVYLLTPRKGVDLWYEPGFYKAMGGAIRTRSISSLPTNLSKEDHYGEVRTCREVKLEKPNVKKIVESPEGEFRYKYLGKEEKVDPLKVSDIVLDPDNIMPVTAKERVMAVSQKYSELFTKRPGKYNGSFGKVDNSINFATTPTPNMKVYVPNYTEDMKKVMGDLMDKLMDYGVLQRPEDVGVTPELVSPSLLVPKTDPGEFRLVTDFSNLNKHIRKYPSTSPTIAEAKKMIARKKHFIHLDLSNYFFQCGMSNKDAQYLCTFHPFRGLVCYVCEPQGLKNASEHGYEVLGRIYGDMCSSEKMTRIADSLFPLGDTYDELITNYEETLRRARAANLTFKPGKVIVCPQNTVLFGWRLSGTEWTPTSHTVSALSRAKLPSTVKGLRSFLGSFKQFSECVRNYSEVLHDLEQLVGGRASAEKIEWNDKNKELFERARTAAADITGVHIPRPSDKLTTYSDYSQDTRAVGGRMVIIRKENGQETKLHGGYFSVILDKLKEHWVPCEAEAAGVRLTLQHFSPYIRESQNITTHYTDNMPTVQAWRRCLQGHFSNSSRISTFLVNLSALSVELEYRPGSSMFSADYISRNPVRCEEGSSCQICKFSAVWQAKGDNSSKLRNISVRDVLEGRVLMPYTQRKTWLGVQLNDSVHVRLKKLISTGQHPEKKKTRGDNTVLKKLYNLYQAGDLKIEKDGLVTVRARDGYYGGQVISVPYQLMHGVAFTLHVKLGHPSKGQLAALMARYFYCHGHTQIIHTVTENCVQCRSLQQMPKELFQDSTEKVEGLGTSFAVDVIERNGQKIFLAREKLSQYTWLSLLNNQTAKELRTAILRAILPWCHPAGAEVRCDGATALASLARESEEAGTLFNDHKIKIVIGRTTNVNKNPVAENAVKECEKEICKYKPHTQQLTEDDLVVISKIMNERVRNRGMAAKEILIKRDVLTGADKKIEDNKLSELQMDKRMKARKARGRTADQQDLRDEQIFHVGDAVYLKSQLSKHQPRQTHIITKIFEDYIIIQKLHSQFRGKQYRVHPRELMPAAGNSGDLFDEIKKNEKLLDKEEESGYSVNPEKEKSDEVERRKAVATKTKVKEPLRKKSSRKAAVTARNNIRNNPNLFTIEKCSKADEKTIRTPAPRTYISSGGYSLEEEPVYEFLLDLNKGRVWSVYDIPEVNYRFLDEDETPFAWLEQIANVEAAADQVNIHQAQELLNHPLKLEAQSDESDPEQEINPVKAPSKWLESFRRQSRNPENPSQVNLHRVQNLDQALEQVQEQVQGQDQNTPRRSARNKKPPDHFGDWSGNF